MKKIKMIAGTYGARINGRLTAITPADGPFDAGESENARLVKAGVAEYVEAADEKPETNSNGAPAPDGLEAVEYNDLVKLAKELGLDTAGKKAALIERINAAQEAKKADAAPGAPGAGDPPAPNLGAADTVVNS